MAPLGFVLDEDLRGLLWRYIVRYNARNVDPVDIIRVGDVEGLHPMDVVTFLAATAYASEPSEWQDRYFYIP